MAEAPWHSRQPNRQSRRPWRLLAPPRPRLRMRRDRSARHSRGRPTRAPANRPAGRRHRPGAHSRKGAPKYFLILKRDPSGTGPLHPIRDAKESPGAVPFTDGTGHWRAPSIHSESGNSKAKNLEAKVSTCFVIQPFDAGKFEIGFAITLRRLQRRKFIRLLEANDIDGSKYPEVVIENTGWIWIDEHESLFVFRRERAEVSEDPDIDDDIPF